MSTAMTIWRFIRYRFDLSDDQDEATDCIESIRRGIVFKGTNLWTLIFAIFVASVGLNMNSTAVVIGAMLISPLMGPIMGLGLGVGIYDFDLIKQSGKNLAIMVVVSLLTSTIYFLLTPLKGAQSELLSRTTPSIWDVVIAFAGGLAGIVAATRVEKGNVVAGVAIATALMPPLCTAGYGLATGQWYYMLGAFYLFSINAVFISFSTLLVVRLLKFPRKEFVSKEVASRVRRNVALVVLLTVLPSCVIAYFIVQKAIFESRSDNFVNTELQDNNVQVIRSNAEYNREGGVIHLYTIGDAMDSVAVQNLLRRLPEYGLNKTTLDLHQGIASAAPALDVNVLRSGILEELYAKNESALNEKNQELQQTRAKLATFQKNTEKTRAVAAEFKALQPTVEQLTLNQNLFFNYARQQTDTLPVVCVRFKKKISKTEQTKLYDWLKVRLAADTLVLIQY